jgi:DNA-directed RNA polymerase subunit RPC12/RpoP
MNNWFNGRYGLDDFGKVIIWASVILYILGSIFKNTFFWVLSLFGVVVFFYRFFSKETYARSEENCKFMRYIKLWKLKYEYRKTARIYMCPNCGKMIRVPKGKGKIQVTCPNCSHTIIRYT